MDCKEICADCPDPEQAKEYEGRACTYKGESIPILGFLEADMGDGKEVIGGKTGEVTLCGRTPIAERMYEDRQLFQSIISEGREDL